VHGGGGRWLCTSREAGGGRDLALPSDGRDDGGIMRSEERDLAGGF
jgi:hypothetical protein